jgi:hypothetical protein
LTGGEPEPSSDPGLPGLPPGMMARIRVEFTEDEKLWVARRETEREALEEDEPG